MLIHAYRRTEPTTVNLFDVDYLFAAHPENKKAFVCEVTPSEAIDRLLSISEGFVEFGKAPPKVQAEATPVMPKSLSDAERELGFRLADGAPLDDDVDLDVEDTRSPEQKAFAEAEALRIAQEEEDERQAVAERDQAIADAKAKEDADAAEALRQSELTAARAAGKQDVPPVAGNPAFVLTAGKGAKAVSVDLNAMDDAALRVWAKEQGLTRLPSKAEGDELRAAIVAKVKG